MKNDGARTVRPGTLVKQERVRACARQLFLERGFGDTSMDAIAESAAVSKQTLYSYYPSKAALFSGVVCAITVAGPRQPLAAGSQPALGDAEALRRALTALAVGIVETMLQPEYLALLRVVIAEQPRFPELAAHFRAAVPDRGFAAIGELLERARQNGLVHSFDREAGGRLFMGALLTYLLYDGLLGGGHAQPPPRERLEAVIEQFFLSVSVQPRVEL
jgi:AcrR family transcriptional regulator